ncbi:MAG TPA: copper-binding protein [Thermoanaerobaculia bacterium]|nr:copper-binding protein [Thermoanaerobaculia bacterium]
MGERERAFRRTLLILLAATTLLSCSGKERKEDTGAGRTYTVRGQVTQLPDPNNPGTGLYLNHEAIDDYVNRSGELVGMDPMTMSFLVDEKVPLEGIQAGDYVELKLRVDWEAETGQVEIVELRELPPDTKLVYRAAKPPKKEPNN